MAAAVDSVVNKYKILSGQHLQDLWNLIFKKGVKGDVLRDILMFYIHHQVYPPPPQKFYDSLLCASLNKGLSKKMRNVIFHIIEVICPSLESIIVETVCLSPQDTIHIELLNSLVIGDFVSLLDESTLFKLYTLLTKFENLNNEECCKLLGFLCEVASNYPILLPNDFVKCFGELMANSLCNNRVTTSTSTQFFTRSDKFSGIEVDGTQLIAGDICTVLTLSNNFSKNHILGIQTFGILHEWLMKVEPEFSIALISDRGLLLGFVREYCSVAVRQCLRNAQNETDKALQKSVLSEILDILFRLVQLDQSQHFQSLLIVKRIQRTISETFRSDPKDISIFVRLLKFLLRFGERSESQVPFCELFLNDIVYRSYSSDLAAFNIVNFLVSEGSEFDSILLQRFYPNLFKLVACHPASLVEEFLRLVPLFVDVNNAVQVFHSLVDLPILSATLCLHQANIVLQQDKNTSLSPMWMTMLENVKGSTLQASYNHMLRKEGSLETELPSHAYISALKDLSNHSLVVTCSQIVTLLVDTFFGKVETLSNVGLSADLLRAILKKMKLVYNVSGYVSAVHKCMTEHFLEILQSHPELIMTIEAEIIEYVSVMGNNEVCPQLYKRIVWAIGAYTSTSLKCYETLECVLYEMLAQINSEEKISLELLLVICSTLAKLASRSQDIIPRLLLSFSKVQRQVSSRLQNSSQDEKQDIHDRIEELISFLKNPNVASPSLVMTSVQQMDPAMSAFLRILAQVSENR